MSQFAKYHRLGNDYLVMCPEDLPFRLDPRAVRLICDRHTGVGGDGVLELAGQDAEGYDLRIHNPDGSPAEKSGNGIAIFAKFLRDTGRATADTFVVRTAGGAVPVEVEVCDGRVRSVTANIGRASFSGPEAIEVGGERLECTCVSLGNPHCVILVPDLGAVDLPRLGPLVESHVAFPNRTNVQLAQVVSCDHVRALIWERGVGETLASGTSSCAVAAACRRRGLVGPEVTVEMRGGELSVRTAPDGSLWITGPVEEVCRGDLGRELLARIGAADVG